MGTKFDVTPEKQASVPRFVYNSVKRVYEEGKNGVDQPESTIN
jgi:hypothetical protein